MLVTDKTHSDKSCASESTQQHTPALSLWSAAMVNWGDDQNYDLLIFVERGDIDPHNLDGNYLFGNTVHLFQATKGTGLPKQGRTSSHDFTKSSETTYRRDLSGRQKRHAVGELFTLCSFFLLVLPFPISCLLPSPLFQSC